VREDEADSRRIALYEELVSIRRMLGGIDRQPLTLLDEVAARVSPESKGQNRVRGLLDLAAGQLEPPKGQAVLIILGTDPSCRSVELPNRREQAAALLNTTPSILVKIEKQLLAELIDNILNLERQALGETREADPSEDHPISVPLSSLVPPAHGGESTEPPHQPYGIGRGNLRILASCGVLLLGGMIVYLVWPSSKVPAPSATSWVPSPDSFSSTTACPVSARQSRTSPTTTNTQTKGPVLIRMDAQPTTATTWRQTLASVQPGSELHYLLTYEDSSRSLVENQVVVRVSLAPGSLLVPDGACVYNQTYPHGIVARTFRIDHGGIDLGNYGPGSIAYVLFSVAMPPGDDVACGGTDINTIGYATIPDLGTYNAKQTTVVNKSC
jgi:hypothetical protein